MVELRRSFFNVDRELRNAKKLYFNLSDWVLGRLYFVEISS